MAWKIAARDHGGIYAVHARKIATHKAVVSGRGARLTEDTPGRLMIDYLPAFLGCVSPGAEDYQELANITRRTVLTPCQAFKPQPMDKA